jgi:hypothetical protein
LLQALPSPDSPLLRAHRPLLFLLLRGASGHTSLGRRQIRSRGVHSHPLLITTIKTRTNMIQETEKEGEAHSPSRRRGA